MKLLLVILIIFITGCKTTRLPLMGEFISIYEEPYTIHVYDCTNKSAKYCNLLREAGYEADVLIVNDSGWHAIVRVKVDGQWLYADPTNLEWSRKMIGEFHHVVDEDMLQNSKHFSY